MKTSISRALCRERFASDRPALPHRTPRHAGPHDRARRHTARRGAAATCHDNAQAHTTRRTHHPVTPSHTCASDSKARARLSLPRPSIYEHSAHALAGEAWNSTEPREVRGKAEGRQRRSGRARLSSHGSCEAQDPLPCPRRRAAGACTGGASCHVRGIPFALGGWRRLLALLHLLPPGRVPDAARRCRLLVAREDGFARF